MNEIQHNPANLSNESLVTEYRFAGTRSRLLMSGTQTQGAFCLFENFKPAGVSTPMHVHEREEETIHVIEGELTATVDDVKHVLRAGSTILLQRNIAHRLHNSGDQTCRYILLATPAGFDDFVADAGEIWDEKKAGTPTSGEEIQRLLKAAPRHGITILCSK